MLYLSNCLIRCVCKKSFLSFSFHFIKKNMQNQNKFVGNSQSFKFAPRLFNWIPPLFMCCNIHHFGITKRKVMASKLQVTASKLQVTASKLQVTASKLQVTASKLQVTPTKLQVTPTKLQVTLTKLQVTSTKLQVTSTKLQVTRSKLTSLTAETNKL